ncbi:MAG: endonuclease/exonuclease/phosphatase family protein [Melioribacteraceae bacterium]|nr:endonuclease/exonuclease/phosphatase family protein [Melioribacteraceae bacterium]
MRRILLILLFTSLIAAQDRIFIDENFDDWSDVTTMHEDPIGDNTPGAEFDFGNLYITNDDEYIYFRIQTTEKIVLVNGNYMTLYIDSDNNPSTGKSIDGIGVEIEFTFGTRRGKSYIGTSSTIYQENIGFIGSPTFSANDFEFVLRRDAQISGTQVFQSNTIKVKLFGYVSSSLVDYEDMIPNEGGFEYTFQSGEVDPVPTYSINKTDPGYLRIMAYNIERDKITDDTPEVQQNFSNVFSTLQPDIIGFSEVYSSSAQAVADRVENYLPSLEGQTWYNKKLTGYDVVLVSRFIIRDSFPIETTPYAHNSSTAFLLDLRPKYDSDMLVVVAHPKCCLTDGSEDTKRQNQFDAIMGFIRDAMNDGGVLTIQPNIPIVVMGDMNLVGDSRQYNTLITGDIFYNNTYGDDFAPDWDGSNFDDSIPFVNKTAMTYTTNTGSYPPGRLDYIVYSGSVMEEVNSYIFNTKTLSLDELNQFGLSENDTEVSDHLPVVADFDLSPITDVKKKDEIPNKFGLMQNYPNPFNPTTTINFTIPNVGDEYFRPLQTQLTVYDILGREIKTLINKPLQAGSYEIQFEAGNLPSGIYYYRLAVGEFSLTKKMVLLR